MGTRIKNIIISITMMLFLGGMGMWLMLRHPDAYSFSERRVLSQKPELSQEAIESGSYTSEFEEFVLDQFPFREFFRRVKSFNEYVIFQKADNNGLYMDNGYLSKIEYPIRKPMLEHAGERFEYIYETYLKEKDITPYFSIIPDKNYFMKKKSNILSMEYEEFYQEMLNKIPYMEYIDITGELALEDYYYTDTHWKQECIKDVAERIGEKMGTTVSSSYEKIVLDTPFYGVYVGQMALPVQPDSLAYLTNSTLKNCKVKCYDTGKAVEKQVYDMDKVSGKDMYEVFLSGAVAVLSIENPNASSDKELVMFRDSFGSSLAPLLLEGYKKITMIDIRYIPSNMIGGFVDFENQDVLFLYSTLVLNNSLGMK